MKSKLCWLVVASVAICLAAESAEATCYGSLDAIWAGVSPGQGVTVHAYPGTIDSPGSGRHLSTSGGVYNFRKTGGTETITGLGAINMDSVPLPPPNLQTHCIDILNYVGGSEAWNVCTLDEAPDPNTLLGGVNISGPKETRLQKLFFLYPDSSIYNLSGSAKSKQAAARQIAVWEIVFEHWKGLNATDTTSSFYVTGNDGAGTLANTMLSDVASYSWHKGDVMPELYAFVDRVEGSGGDQDQVWLVPGGGDTYIPEPLTMLGMFLGLGGVGAYVRRRRMV